MSAPVKFLMKYDIFLFKNPFKKRNLLKSFNFHFQWLPAKSDPGSQLGRILQCSRFNYLLIVHWITVWLFSLTSCTLFRIIKPFISRGTKQTLICTKLVPLCLSCNEHDFQKEGGCLDLNAVLILQKALPTVTVCWWTQLCISRNLAQFLCGRSYVWKRVNLKPRDCALLL